MRFNHKATKEKMKKQSYSIFNIFIYDFKSIVRNWAASILLIGMIVLPPIYAWLNIYASWDPYGNTGGLKVAVVNEDNGATVANQEFNVGNEIESSLKTNTKLGWVFCDDQDDAMTMVQNGEVYAAIIIPTDFSLSLTTFFDDDPQKPTISYYVNEKENAVAPKIISSAMTTLKSEISSDIIETAVEKVYQQLNNLGSTLQDNSPEIEELSSVLSDVTDDVPSIPEQLDNIASNVQDGIITVDRTSDDFQSLMNTTDELNQLNDGLAETITNASLKTQDISPEIRSSLESAQTLLLDISNDASDLSDKASEFETSSVDDIDQMLSDLEKMKSNINSVSEELSDINNNDLPELKATLESVSDDMTNIQNLLKRLKTASNDFENFADILSDISDTCDDASDSLDTLQTSLNDFVTSTEGVLDSLSSLCAQTKEIVDAIDSSGVTENISQVIASNISSLQAISTVVAALPIDTGTIGDSIEQLISSLQTLSGTVGTGTDTSTISETLSELTTSITELNTTLDTIASKTDSSLSSTQDTLEDVGSLCDDLADDIEDIHSSVTVTVNGITSTLTQIKSVLSNSEDVIDDIIAFGDDNIEPTTETLNDYIDTLSEDLTNLSGELSDQSKAIQLMDDVHTTAFEAQSSLGTLINYLNDENIKSIQTNLDNSASALTSVNDSLTRLKLPLSDLSDFMADAADDGQVSVDQYYKIKDETPELQDSLNEVSDNFKSLLSDFNLDDVIDLLGKDSSSQSEYFSSPVELEDHEVYTSENYGKGLTPFYSALAVWVGCLFLGAMLKTSAEPGFTIPNSVEEYWGKYLLFGLVAVLQGLVTALGNIFLLKVSMHDPFLFTLLSMFYSLIFSLIVYSLVATFKNLGKALGIILLLFQITASGGTFPIQVTPALFQAVHPFIPFTYAIGGFREALYGVNFDSLVTDILRLILFGAGFTVIGLFLRKQLHKVVGKVSHTLHQSHVIH